MHRGHDAVAFMDENAALVQTHSGHAFAEADLLRRIVNNIPSGPAGLVGDVHKADLMRRVPKTPDLASVYVFTHEIFYASDFGRVLLHDLPSDYRQAIEDLVQEYIHDADILGELLICAKCIGYWSDALTSAMAAFTTVWEALDRTNFAENYHTILMGGILFSMP